MMDIKVSGKINLCLDILGSMDNGYHSVDTVIQTVDVYDALSIDISDTISVDCPGIDEKTNTAYKAAEAFFAGKQISGGCSISIRKGIPFAAGMGGSSSDAAAVLRCLNMLYDGPYSENELLSIGSRIGADVPVLMTGGCQRCRGIGEILENVPSEFHFTALAVRGNGFVTAGRAYSTYDSIGGDHPDTEKVIDSLKSGDMDSLIRYSANALERACLHLCTDCASVMDIFRNDSNCLHSFLTGSGTAVIGIYRTDEDAVLSQKLFGDRQSVVIHDTRESLIIL